ncbi:FkbM family methyltransferase [Azospirillum sp. SYSU D00513]|uniref:FkbM family methyltransferase n=1 Tax=Azospirillum sp. SYSU D00513 TaxID=2812561 RepID=UPI001A962AAD|nr:FkbM family methyltransferase [Azospirillum sp. SYSU D00513]
MTKINIRRSAFEDVIRLVSDEFLNFSFSQEGEDVLFDRITEGKITKGFYVDVGAHHPRRFSSTYSLYLKGWSGINIEPNPELASLLNLERKRDININMGVSNARGSMKYYMFKEPALNTFSESRYEELKSEWELLETKSIDVLPLSEILNNYLPQGRRIDLMNIDVEGLDIEVINSNNWEKFSPDYLLVEDRVDILEIRSSYIFKALSEFGYIPISKLDATFLYKKTRAV